MAAKTYLSHEIRNVAIMGHSQCGKTALMEAIHFNTGATTRLGRTQDNTSVFDTEPEEIRRIGSIVPHFGWTEFAGKKINLIDTPGDGNFFLSGATAMMGGDSMVAVVSAPNGVQLQTRRAWAAAGERNLTRVIFVNKMDRGPRAWADLLAQIGTALKTSPVALQVPLGAADRFAGVVDLFTKKACRWPADGSGKMSAAEVPPELKEEVDSAYAQMAESIVSTDDALLEAYLEGGEVNPDLLKSAFLKALGEGKIVPLLFGAASLNIGVQPLLDLITSALPSPLARTLTFLDNAGARQEFTPKPDDSFLAQVVHTTVDEHVGQLSYLRVFSGSLPKDGVAFNPATKEEVRLGTFSVARGKETAKIDAPVCGDLVVAAKLKGTHTNNSLTDPKNIRTMPPMTYPRPMLSYVLHPAEKKDDDKLKVAVDRLLEEDPSLSLSYDELSHRLVLSGMGHGHLDTAVERLSRKYHVSVHKDIPPVPYRETFARPVQMVEGKHKKQTGGAGQFGVCYIDVEPRARGEGYEFANEIYGGAIPRQFIPSVEKGIAARMRHGLAAGYPVIDFRVRLKDGKHHPVDSKDIAFQQAGVKALKAAMEKAGMKILEPFYKMEVVVPNEFAGAVMGDVSTRRGQVGGMENLDDLTMIKATCPLAEIQRYVPDLHSMTQGQGTFTMEFDCYREVPPHLVDKIREASPFKKEAAAEEED